MNWRLESGLAYWSAAEMREMTTLPDPSSLLLFFDLNLTAGSPLLTQGKPGALIHGIC